MASNWAKKLPVVSVVNGETPKPVTIVLPYYDNPHFLQSQIAWWGTYPPVLRASLSAVIVDDGSAEPAVLPAHLPCAIRLFRIAVDVRWNWLAARNIGAHHAADGWLVLTDMDHAVPVETLRSLVYGQHDPAVVYAFSRREHTGESIAPHSASFFMTREMFWTIGGYDERMSGFYGSDGLYRRRVSSLVPLNVLSDHLVRYEYVGDSSTRAYQRKEPRDAALRAMVAKFPFGSKPRTLSFPYAEVTA